MTIQMQENPILEDLGLLAIEAAEELERYKKNLNTDLKSVKLLSSLLQNSFNQVVDGSGTTNYRLDHASVLFSTFSSINAPKKTLAEIAEESIQIAEKLLVTDPSISNLDRLISFCVALSDSAAIYDEELNELRKH